MVVTTFLIGGTIAFGLPAQAYYRAAHQVDAGIKVLTIPHFGLFDMAGAMEHLEQHVIGTADANEPIDLVGHSQGAVLCGWIAARHPDLVGHAVGVYGPFNGARVTPAWGMPICKYLKHGSPLVQALSLEVGSALGSRFTSIFSTNDRIASPFQTGYVPGGRNVLYTTDELFAEHAPELPGVLHLPTSRPPGHLDIGRRKLLAAICAGLGRSAEDPVRQPVPAQRSPSRRRPRPAAQASL